MRLPLLGASALLVLALPAHALDLRADTKAYPTDGLRALHLTLPAGEVLIEGTDDDHARITVGVHCDGHSSERCRELARKLELESRRDGDALVLEVRDEAKWRRGNAHVRFEVQVPRRLALEVEFGAGELEVIDVGRDIDVEMGAGEATFRLREADVSSVRATVGVGEASLRSGDRTYPSRGFISRTLNWEGDRGIAHVKVALGAGEVSFRLH